MNCLAGQVAVVTGASGGIGRAVALELARQGADVVVHGFRQRKTAEALAAEILGLGRESHVLIADLSDEASCRSLADDAWRWKSGGIDIWVNVAGADVLTGDVAQWPF